MTQQKKGSIVSRRRVVITGLGLISPVGNTVAEGWENLVAGRSGIANITKFDASAHKVRFAGEVKNFDTDKYLSPKEARRMDTFIHFGLAAGIQAFEDSGLQVTAENAERIGDQRAMAAPRHRLRAHDRDTFSTACARKRLHRFREGGRLHVIGISAEAFVAPAGVRGALAAVAQAAERGHGQVFDPAVLQCVGQGIRVELRVVTGPRHRADIRQRFYSAGVKEAEEAVDGQRGMTDREYRSGRPIGHPR